MAALAQVSGRNPADHREWRHILCDYRASRHNSTMAYPDIGQYNGAGPEIDIIFNDHRSSDSFEGRTIDIVLESINHDFSARGHSISNSEPTTPVHEGIVANIAVISNLDTCRSKELSLPMNDTATSDADLEQVTIYEASEMVRRDQTRQIDYK